MSTRSMILREEDNGLYLGIYCHHDGYLSHNGAILLKYYNTRKKLEKLLELGDLSYLAPKVKPRPGAHHDYDHPQEGVCVFYGRDRGEIATGAEYVTLEDMDNDPWIEYTYVFTRDNKWKYFRYKELNEGLQEVL
jgi:hypothetical protein